MFGLFCLCGSERTVWSFPNLNSWGSFGHHKQHRNGEDPQKHTGDSRNRVSGECTRWGGGFEQRGVVRVVDAGIRWKTEDHIFISLESICCGIHSFGKTLWDFKRKVMT